MKVLAVIPARKGSKGVPNKNIKFLHGKPLIDYTIESCKSSRLLTKFIVSTDYTNIRDIAQIEPLQFPFIRPPELSGDSVPMIDVIKHALFSMQELGENYDFVCVLQPTTPFRDEGLIDRGIEKIISLGCDSLISVKEVPDEYNPHWVFEEKTDGLLALSTREASIISRRQDLPKAYHRDGGLYITKTAIVQNEGSLYGETIGFIRSNSPLINIDTSADWDDAVNFQASLNNM